MCPQNPYAEAIKNVGSAAVTTLDLDGGKICAGVELHEVDGAFIALGRVPFSQMMEAVLTYVGAISYDPEDYEQHHRMLRHLTYRSVSITPQSEGPPTIDWESGLTPVTAYRPAI